MSLQLHIRMQHHLCMKESVSLVEITKRALCIGMVGTWERGLGVSINSAVCLAHLVAGSREELNARTNTQSVGNQRSP